MPEDYAFESSPVYLTGAVTTGFGRGSRQLGVPTANLPPAPLARQLAPLPSGVFFGWAQLEAAPGAPCEDGQVGGMHGAVGSRRRRRRRSAGCAWPRLPRPPGQRACSLPPPPLPPAAPHGHERREASHV